MNEQETLIVEFDEPQITETTPAIFVPAVIAGSIILAVVLGSIAYFQKDFTFYMAAAATLAGGAMVVVQKKRPADPLHVVLTTTRLVVGKKEFSLSELAGFWPEFHGEQLAINVEPKKAALFPISFIYPDSNPDTARQTLLQVLGEVEPRNKNITDSLNKYFRL